LLLAEFIHRSANDFAVACAEMRIAAGGTTLDRVRDQLTTAIERLHALAAIQRLLQPPREGVMDLADKLCALCHYQAQARFAEQAAFVHCRSVDIRIDSPRGWALLMIVAELLTNAARHAFQGPGGFIHVDLARHDGEIHCVVRDDGIGMQPASVTPRAGTAIIAELARAAGIRMTARTCPAGTAFDLRMTIETSGMLVAGDDTRP
jgi:two-component sensor histidine kinase